MCTFHACLLLAYCIYICNLVSSQLDCKQKYSLAADTYIDNIALPQPSFSNNYFIVTLDAASSPHIHLSYYSNPFTAPSNQYNLQIVYDFMDNDHKTAVRRVDGTGQFGFTTIYEANPGIDLVNGVNYTVWISWDVNGNIALGTTSNVGTNTFTSFAYNTIYSDGKPFQYLSISSYQDPATFYFWKSCTSMPTTAAPTITTPSTTTESNTNLPTTASPTTYHPSVAEPTTASPTSNSPTTAEPSSLTPTTIEPTTLSPTRTPSTAHPTSAPSVPNCLLSKSVELNYDLSNLINDGGWVRCYFQPYSDGTNWADLQSCVPGQAEDYSVFVGALQTSSSISVTLGAFAPSEVLTTDMGMINTAYKPVGYTNDGTYTVYWYNNVQYSFGFAPVSDVILSPTDSSNQIGDAERLSWHLDGSGGWRAGSVRNLNSNSVWHKVIYYKYCPKPIPPTTLFPTLMPTYNPTTYNPTTSRPTTNPTTDPTIDPTFNPTKYPSIYPTIHPSIYPTSNPTTANPTTSIPTTHNPTTAKPSTIMPTTSNPSNPPTYNPTTTVPTTSLPTAMITSTMPTSSPISTSSRLSTVLPTANPTTLESTEITSTADLTTINPTTLSPTKYPTTHPTDIPSIAENDESRSNEPTSAPTSEYRDLLFICHYNDNSPDYYALYMSLLKYAELLIQEILSTAELILQYSVDYDKGEINKYAAWKRSGISYFKICTVFTDKKIPGNCTSYQVMNQVNNDADYTTIGRFGIVTDVGLNKYKTHIMNEMNSDSFKIAFTINMKRALSNISDTNSRGTRVRNLLQNIDFHAVSIQVIDPYNITSTETPIINDGQRNSSNGTTILIVIVIITLFIIICIIVGIIYFKKSKLRDSVEKEGEGTYNDYEIEMNQKKDEDKENEGLFEEKMGNEMENDQGIIETINETAIGGKSRDNIDVVDEDEIVDKNNMNDNDIIAAINATNIDDQETQQ